MAMRAKMNSMNGDYFVIFFTIVFLLPGHSQAQTSCVRPYCEDILRVPVLTCCVLSHVVRLTRPALVPQVWSLPAMNRRLYCRTILLRFCAT